MAYRQNPQTFQCPNCTDTRKTKSGIFGHMASKHPDWEYDPKLVYPVKEEETQFQTMDGGNMVKLKKEKKSIDSCPECKEPLYGNEYRCPNGSCKEELVWDNEEKEGE